MSAASDYLENKLLDHVLRYSTAPYTAPSTVYLALFTSINYLEANNIASASEISGTGTAYARQAITFGNAATNGSITNTAAITFPTATADWGIVTTVAVMDGGTRAQGNVLFYGNLTISKNVTVGDTFTINTNNLTVTLA
jgi:hypothetical protein